MNYSKNSFYNWPCFPKKTLKIRLEIMSQIIEDYIELSDFFYELNNFINIGNSEKINYFHLENNLHGFEKVFTLCMITNEEHKQIITTKAENMIKTTRGKSGNIKDRTESLCNLIKTTALELKNL